MTWLMVAFVLLALICMVMLNPATKVVDRLLIARQPWRLKASGQKDDTKINMALGTRVPLHMQGGDGGAAPQIQSSSPDIAAVLDETNGMGLYAKKSGEAFLFKQPDAQDEPPKTLLRVTCIEPETVQLSVDQQKITPGSHPVWPLAQQRKLSVAYQWYDKHGDSLAGVVTSHTPFVQMPSNAALDAHQQKFCFIPTPSSPTLEVQCLEQNFVFYQTPQAQAVMQAVATEVPAMDYFTDATKKNMSVQLQLQLCTKEGEPYLLDQSMGQPTEIRWRKNQETFSNWTRPYEKDKPIVYVVQRQLDDKSRWVYQLTLHPFIAQNADALTLQFRHRNFSNRQLSLQESLWLPEYQIDIQGLPWHAKSLQATWLAKH